jgi:hypothetical protein
MDQGSGGLVRLPIPPEVRIQDGLPPSALRGADDPGIPADLLEGRFTAAKEVTMLTPTLARIGTARMADDIVVDLSDGRVGWRVAGTVHVLFVNSSLDQFVATINAVNARYPFYGRNSDLKDRKDVGDELTTLIHAIDPPAASPGQFWSSLVDDVVIGDFDSD